MIFIVLAYILCFPLVIGWKEHYCTVDFKMKIGSFNNSSFLTHQSVNSTVPIGIVV